MVLRVGQKQGTGGVMQQEADARRFHQKQLLNRHLVFGNQGIKGKVFLKGNMLAVVGAAVAGLLFLLSAAAAGRLREQGNFFEGSSAIMRYQAHTHRRKHIGENDQRKKTMKNNFFQGCEIEILFTNLHRYSIQK